MTKAMTCIVCPVGCRVIVELDGDKVTHVEGNSCPRGNKYAVSECTAPVRTLTTTVRVDGCVRKRINVKTSTPIAKDRIFEAMTEIRKLKVCSPVKRGDIIADNICDSSVVSCSDVE